jgi:hypothetical protein
LQVRHGTIPGEPCRLFEGQLAERAAQATQNNLAGLEELSDWDASLVKPAGQLVYMLGLDPMPSFAPLNVASLANSNVTLTA